MLDDIGPLAIGAVQHLHNHRCSLSHGWFCSAQTLIHDSRSTALKHLPIVELVTTTYQSGLKLTKDAMKMVETQLQRFPGLDKWFVDIVPTVSTIPAT